MLLMYVCVCSLMEMHISGAKEVRECRLMLLACLLQCIGCILLFKDFFFCFFTAHFGNK